MASNPIDCIRLHAKNLFKDVDENISREAATDLALKEYEKLHGELEDFKKSINPKYQKEKYVSPDKSKEINAINEKYKSLIEAAIEKTPEPKEQSLPASTKEQAGSGGQGEVGHAENIKTKFREQFKVKGNTDEQIDGAVALMDARAKSWASEEKGRTPEQWFDKIADVKSGEFETSDVQFQGGKLRATIIGAMTMLQPMKVNEVKVVARTEQSTKYQSKGEKTIVDILKNYYKENNETPPQEVIDRALYLWEKFGRPEILPDSTSKDERAYATYENGKPKIGNITNFDDFVAELSHSAQYVSGKEMDNRQYATEAERDNIEYNRKGSQEYKAHKEVEPILANYIFTGDSSKLNKIQYQEGGSGKQGALETLKDGRVVIHALNSPDFSTMVHEIAHVFEKDLTAAEQKVVDDFGGSEPFARGFERYLREGKAPTVELKTLFDKFKQWLTNIYKTLKGSPIAKRISPEIKQIFDRLLTEPTTPSNLPKGEEQKPGVNAINVIMPGENKAPNIIPLKKYGEATEIVPGDAQAPPIKPPVDNAKNENADDGKEFDKLVNNVPQSDKFAEYMSKDSIRTHTGENPENDQRRGVQELRIALEHGEKIIDKAKELFGNDYVEKTLEYIENSTAAVSNKALMYVSLENALGREKLANPDKAADIAKLQKLVYAKSQDFGREASLALNYSRLRKIAQIGYDISRVTDNFFSAEELEAKGKVEKSTEATGDQVNEQAEKDVQNEVEKEEAVTEEMEQAIKAGVEKEIAKLYENLPAERKSKADKAIAALDRIHQKLRGKTYESTLGIPIAIIDGAVLITRNAIRVGVKVAKAIELGIADIKSKYKDWNNEDEFRKDYTEAFKKEGLYDGELTNSERLAIAKEKVQQKIDLVRQEIAAKTREKKKSKNRVQDNQALTRLKEELNTLEQLRDKYLPEKEDPYAYEKIKDKKIQQLTDEVVVLNKQIENEQKNPKEKQEDKFKQDEDINKMREEKAVRESILEAIDPTPKAFVAEALVEVGFGRKVPVKTKRGEEIRTIIDWRKLATDANSVDKIEEQVEGVMRDKGYSEEMILRTKDAFAEEYINLRAKVIENALNDIAKKNKTTVTKYQKSAARKLAEMYAYGLFDTMPGEFELTLNKTIGASVSEEGFVEATKIAEAMRTVYLSSFQGNKLTESSAKFAIENIENDVRKLLVRESRKQGNRSFRMASIVREYFDISQTMVLNNMKQMFENPISGYEQNIFERLGNIFDGNAVGTKEMIAKRRSLMKSVFKDMILHGGIGYGKVDTTFVNREHIDDHINSLSDNQLYHGIMSTVTGKLTLNTMDAMFKASITEQKFAANLVKLLTHETNKNRFTSKEDAIKFVSQQLTGQNLEDAKATARETIEKINADAGFEIISPNEESVNRLANDIVKSALEVGGRINSEQIMAAYNAAYRSAGLGLGHVSNNFFSTQVSDYSAKLEGRISRAIQNKEWNKASALMIKSILFRNILNPFVGGGTNWLVLKFEKMGVGLFTGLGYTITKGKDGRIDMSGDAGAKKIEDALYLQARAKDSFVRGIVGGTVSALTYIAVKALESGDDEDDYRKWRKKNMWAARYTDIVSPEWLLMDMAAKNKDMLGYISRSFNKNDNFDPITKISKSAKYFSEGKSGKGWGALGELVGGKVSAPIPWRLVKDGQVVYQGAKGEDPYHGNYKPSNGFINGAFQGGVIEWFGLRPGMKK